MLFWEERISIDLIPGHSATSEKSGMTPLITQLTGYFNIIPISPRNLLSVHGLVNFMIPSSQLAGWGMAGFYLYPPGLGIAPSSPLMLWYSPYPRMQDL